MALFTFVAFFMATSGGLFFFIHHCNRHHVTEVMFYQQQGGSCCHHGEAEHCCATAQDEHSGSNTACLQEEGHAIGCCSNTPFFLKVAYQFTKSSELKVDLPFMWLSSALLQQRSQLPAADLLALSPSQCTADPVPLQLTPLRTTSLRL